MSGASRSGKETEDVKVVPCGMSTLLVHEIPDSNMNVPKILQAIVGLKCKSFAGRQDRLRREAEHRWSVSKHVPLLWVTLMRHVPLRCNN
jgi:hypothetical protein